MNDKRKTIYVGEPLERLLASRIDDSGVLSVSGLINALADRYQAIVRQSMPTLSLAEWSLIIDVMNGTITWDHLDSAAYGLIHNVEDGIRLDGLDKKWQINGAELITKLQDLPYSSLIAITDAVERFWCRGTRVIEKQDWRDDIASIVGKNNIRP